MIIKGYLLRVLIAFDQLIQAALKYGIPGQTISARAGKAMKRGRRWGCVLCQWLDRLDPGHCDRAIANDRKRAQAVIDDLAGF